MLAVGIAFKRISGRIELFIRPVNPKFESIGLKFLVAFSVRNRIRAEFWIAADNGTQRWL